MKQIEKTIENKWEQTTDRFVAFFDIMGFKDLVLKTQHERIFDLLKILSESRANLESKNLTELDNGLKLGQTKSFTFSDSIFLFTKTDSSEDAFKILLDCIHIMHKSLEHQIPIKGAISFGKITLDLNNSIYFGQPIIDAFLLQEDLQLYSVIADHSFQKKIQDKNIGELDAIFSFYKAPLKSGKANHYILKPSLQLREKTIDYLNNLYRTVSGKPRQYIDNTIDFINSLDSQKK